jgi:repressor LexA
MRRTGVTRAQRRVLEAITQYTRERGFPPTVRELCRLVSNTSTSTVYAHLNALQRKGFIHRMPGSPRAIQILRTEPREEP